jgi:SAM-dependent methyltransferase
MTLRGYARALRHRVKPLLLKVREPNKERFDCPICGYQGPFVDMFQPTGTRRHAQCPACDALERHRLQFVVVNEVLKGRDSTKLSALHFAPEPCFEKLFAKRFGNYESADLSMKGVTHHVDLLQLPFADGSYDFVFASHVLEHIREDDRAISELRRILRPNGIAILPVPIVAQSTIEYPRPSPSEGDHVRAPGFDYFKRYERYFAKVEPISSESVPRKYQPFVYEDRSVYPTAACPWRPSMPGEKHLDVVPVCYV